MKKILLTLTALGILATTSFAETEILGGRYTDFGFKSNTLIDCKDFKQDPTNTIESLSFTKDNQEVSYVIFANEFTEQVMITDINNNTECHNNSGLVRTFKTDCSFESEFSSKGSVIKENINRLDGNKILRITKEIKYNDHNFLKQEFEDGSKICYVDLTKNEAMDLRTKGTLGFVGTTVAIGTILGGPIGAGVVLGFYGINYFLSGGISIFPIF